MIKIAPPQETIEKLPGEIQMWMGWPVWDVRLGQYEKDHWFAAVGVEEYSNFFGDMDAQKALEVVLRWNRIS